jgi:two-component system, cell cycle sensor histidine kinase and response regulator CckA
MEQGTVTRAPEPAPAEPPAVQAGADQRLLEALSRMAGGVAHDMNNILLVIQGYTDMALAEADAGAETLTLIAEAKEAVGRASAMVQDLLAAGMRGPFSPRLMDPSEAVRRQLPRLQAWCREGVRIEPALREGLPLVLVEEDLLARLLRCACALLQESVGPDGAIHVQTAAAAGPDGADSVSLSAWTDAAAEQAPPAAGFEPYLPGRSGGKGPGLAPLLVYAAARRLGGEASLEPRGGRGPSVTVLLPSRASVPEPPRQAAAAARPQEPPAAQTAARARPTATVLIAEDDDGLRALAAKILSREGYAVIEARDGQAAVEAFERGGRPIALVILDDVMPRLGGRAALERIRRVSPDVPVILCSGYTWRLDEKPAAPGEPDDSCVVLAKPWQPRELLRRVREALGPAR